MTPVEIRRYRRYRRQRLWNIVHTSILFCLIVTMILVLGNLYALTVMQVDALNAINDMRLDLILDQETENSPEGQAEPTAYTLTPEERDLICRVVAAEARGEDIQGQMAVANVILDRAVLWDMPVTEVVTAPGQFAKPYQEELSDETRLAVANVFDGGVRVFEEPVTHFHANYVDPYWAAGKESRGSIGRHGFWY